MKTISLQCPNCGSMFEVGEDRTFCFCSYCGNKILLDKEQHEITHRIIDEARLKELENLQRAEEAERKIAEEKRTRIFKVKMILLIIWIVIVAILAALSNATLDNVGFSPYHLVLIPVVIFGIVMIVKEIKKFFQNN